MTIAAIAFQMLFMKLDPVREDSLSPTLECLLTLVFKDPSQPHEAALTEVMDRRVKGLDRVFLVFVRAQQAKLFGQVRVNHNGLCEDRLREKVSIVEMSMLSALGSQLGHGHGVPCPSLLRLLLTSPSLVLTVRKGMTPKGVSYSSFSSQSYSKHILIRLSPFRGESHVVSCMQFPVTFGNLLVHLAPPYARMCLGVAPIQEIPK